MACRVLGVSTSGYYEAQGRPPSALDIEGAYLLSAIRDISPYLLKAALARRWSAGAEARRGQPT